MKKSWILQISATLPRLLGTPINLEALTGNTIGKIRKDFTYVIVDKYNQFWKMILRYVMLLYNWLIWRGF